MKRIFTAAFSIVLLLSVLASQAQDKRDRQTVVKEKNISKTFASGGKQLVIENSFGNVKFITWDKNEIKVDIHIEASASDEATAEKLFNHIGIEEKQNGNDIKFKTTFSKDGVRCKDCKTSMYIDYEIHMPASAAVDVENSFGNTEIPDLTGAISVSSKFGNLKAGSLPNLKKFNVEFGKAEIKNVANIDAVFKFSQITIGNLGGKSHLKLEFCDATKINLDKSLTSLTIKESYCNINLRPVVNFSASYSIDTKFGSFTDRTNSNIKRTDKPDEYGPDANKSYSGQTGSGAAKIEIDSNFGTIILGEPTADDVKVEKKQKGKVI